jgi:hypothetical protein
VLAISAIAVTCLDDVLGLPVPVLRKGAAHVVAFLDTAPLVATDISLASARSDQCTLLAVRLVQISTGFALT